MTSLWLAPPGVHYIDLDRYSTDFRVLIDQLLEEGFALDEHNARVVVGPYDAFIDWAVNEEPDWDRYTWDAVKQLMERKIISPEHLNTYDSPATWKVINASGVSDESAYRIGWLHYVQSLGTSILVGDDVPPLAAVNGVPADGRHRTIAAFTARMAFAPVLDLEPA